MWNFKINKTEVVYTLLNVFEIHLFYAKYTTNTLKYLCT